MTTRQNNVRTEFNKKNDTFNLQIYKMPLSLKLAKNCKIQKHFNTKILKIR